ncbi:MAG TPA: aldo/keto reductase [Thermoanaerobaculia bacterium]|nr:aldo/keto reductase [Thermoanaerobaculia bacterium]
MDSKRIGSLTVSTVGLGCNNFGTRLDAAATAEVVHAALDSGINFFDTADIYGKGLSEEYLGRALGPRRAGVVVASKFGMVMDEHRKGAKPAYIRQAVEDSLRRLGTDVIDLYQLHEPDPEVPLEETMGALNELVAAGKVREIGCSNFTAEQLRLSEEVADRTGTTRFVSVQNEYSLLHREPERGVLAECERLRIGFIPYFPLASGLLTGKYRRGRPVPQGTRLSSSERFGKLLNDKNLTYVERLAEIGEARERTLLEIAFGWLLAKPVVVSVIAGATSPEQVRANAGAARRRLTDEELQEIEGVVAVPA